MEIIKNLMSKEWFRYVLVLLAGITIGVVFYPSKRVEERVSQKYEKEITTLKQVHSKESSELQEKLDKTVSESKSFQQESEKKISTLSVQIRDLKSKQKIATFKLIKPDGTIEEKTYTETEINESSKVVTQIQEEFKTKISQIENKWETLHKERLSKVKQEFDSKEQSYQKEIASLKSEKITDVNHKKFGLEAGMLLNRDYYGHVTADIWGPVFLGIHGQVGATSNLGLGLGLRF